MTLSEEDAAEDVSEPITPKILHGKTLVLLRPDGSPILGIRWRVFGYGSNQLYLRSLDGSTKSVLNMMQFDALEQSHALAVYLCDPLDDALAELQRRKDAV